ncbi:MAG: DegT/DnrJ/EryC1/StrS family aminotransferase, partial [Clostridiales bacterium]|nr:DegT/DnrJ/EryC1/StrS family aminotransferase [Clostridiales bacterium]
SPCRAASAGLGGPGISAEAAEAAIRRHPDAAAIFLTRPDYYGNTCDIEPIAEIARRHGIPLLVDEAHGAHLCFSGRLPVSALAAGADFCVQSAHKTLPALTQAAYAHMSARAAADGALAARFSGALRALQTSSPSFVLLASLDYAREYMQERGEAELGRVLDQCEAFYDAMRGLGYGIPANIWPPGVGEPRGLGQGGGTGDGLRGAAAPGCDRPSCNNLGNDRPGNGHFGGDRPGANNSGNDNPGVARYGRDMTRLVLGTAGIGLPGTAVEKLLARRHGIAIEMSDPGHIVMVAAAADRDEDFGKLRAALAEIARGARAGGGGGRGSADADTPAPVGAAAPIAAAAPASAAMPPDFMGLLHAQSALAAIPRAVGRRAAALVIPYPPGVPLLCPGEIITREKCAALLSLLGAGVKIIGITAAPDPAGALIPTLPER